MNFTTRSVGLTALACLVVGFLLGFIPEYVAKSQVETQMMELMGRDEATQKSLQHTERQVKLNEFALQAAVSLSVRRRATTPMLRRMLPYCLPVCDSTSITETMTRRSQEIRDILTMRDATIAGLAKADPSVRPSLAQMFQKLKTLSSPEKS